MSKHNNMPHKPVWPSGAETGSDARFETPREETTFHAHEDHGDAPKGGRGTSLVVISLIIGFGIGWFSAGGDAPKGTGTENENGNATTTEEVVLENEGVVAETEEETVSEETVEPNEFGVQLEVPAGTTIRVSDQFAGDGVIVDSLELKRNGWVAVYEDRGDGKPGNILGAQRFEKGIYTQSRVVLQRPTVAGATYFVRIHADDGDLDFEFKTVDVPLTDTSGNAFTVSFKTTAVEGSR